jgi:hypothetical protein
MQGRSSTSGHLRPARQNELIRRLTVIKDQPVDDTPMVALPGSDASCGRTESWYGPALPMITVFPLASLSKTLRLRPN